MGDTVLLDDWWTDDEDAEEGIVAVSQVPMRAKQCKHAHHQRP